MGLCSSQSKSQTHHQSSIQNQVQTAQQNENKSSSVVQADQQHSEQNHVQEPGKQASNSGQKLPNEKHGSMNHTKENSNNVPMNPGHIHNSSQKLDKNQESAHRNGDQSQNQLQIGQRNLQAYKSGNIQHQSGLLLKSGDQVGVIQLTYRTRKLEDNMHLAIEQSDVIISQVTENNPQKGSENLTLSNSFRRLKLQIQEDGTIKGQANRNLQEQCKFCSNFIEESEIRTLCEHSYHIQCLIDFMTKQVIEEKATFLSCDCKKHIRTITLRHFMINDSARLTRALFTNQLEKLFNTSEKLKNTLTLDEQTEQLKEIRRLKNDPDFNTQLLISYGQLIYETTPGQLVV